MGDSGFSHGASALDREAQYLKGVGPRNAALLAKAGIRTLRDLLYYLPRRYEDRTNLPSIGSIRPGQNVTVRGRLIRVEGRPLRRGMVRISATLVDSSSSVNLVWFNQPWIQRKLSAIKGEIIAFGTVKESGFAYEIQNPEFEVIDADDDGSAFARITPVYPLVEGLNQSVVRRAVKSALAFPIELDDPLPEAIRKRFKLPGLGWSLRQSHVPDSLGSSEQARRRLVFEEFLGLQLTLALKRSESHAESGISYPISELGRVASSHEPLTLFDPLPGQAPTEPLWTEIGRMLPFELTGAQRRAIEEIFADMESPHPMNRLLQGDVGSGKTAVGACAMLAAVRCGYQAAIMAPTEILAEQHFSSLSAMFAPLGIEVALLVGKLTASPKKRARSHAASGHAGIVVGTHALIQEGVEFKRLGLVVIDEQHRFGVLQRAALRGKGLGNPDVLVMTATPIPRTLTMTLYGDMDLTIIDELPPGRRPVKTHRKFLEQRESVYQAVRKLIEEGRQAYFVCPLVSESEKVQAHAAEELHFKLANEVYPDLKVGLVHGQMKPTEKDRVMQEFRDRDLDILVSTTVIEVGVDVPNASVMVIQDADRFGLSQLHQLRGRVGRGAEQSYCVLLADRGSREAEERLEIMAGTTDGFKIAEADLRIRGPGELLGTRQTGALEVQIGDLVRDQAIMEEARRAAQEVIKGDPELASPQNRGLAELVRRRRAVEASLTVS